MQTYTSKRQTVKPGMLAKCPYIPNQLVYIAEIKEGEFIYYGFFKSAGSDAVKPQKHNIKKGHIKGFFETLPADFKPAPSLEKMIRTITKQPEPIRALNIQASLF